MLSPNARKRVYCSRGGSTTRTAKLQATAWPVLSDAVQVMFASPTGSVVPDAGEHAVVGVRPPVTVGVNVTPAAMPSAAGTSKEVGHWMDNWAGGAGPVGGPPHPATIISAATAMARTVRLTGIRLSG